MKTGLLSAAHRPGHATLGANALLALAYTATGLAGLRFEFFHVAVTTVWPPSGIALAALLLFGLRFAPPTPLAGKRVSFQRVNSRIARSRPCSVSGYMRSPIRLRIMPMDS